MTNITNQQLSADEFKWGTLPLSDSREDEKHPEVYAKYQHHLKNTLPQQGLLQIEGPVHYHGTKLDEQHDQESFRDLVLWQGLGNVSCSRVFLNNDQRVTLYITLSVDAY